MAHKLKIGFALLLFFLLSACNPVQKNPTSEAKRDSHREEMENIPDARQAGDSAILTLTRDILTIVKTRDFSRLAAFVHPVEGVRFSPYGYIDTSANRVLSASVFQNESKRKQRFFWGSYDGSGDSIQLTIPEYFSKFVYDADFLHAEKTSLNTILSHGNTRNNLKEVYPGCPFTESYFSGFDKKAEGMDWRSLRLVYKKYKDRYYLVGIVHDQWTI